MHVFGFHLISYKFGDTKAKLDFEYFTVPLAGIKA